MSTGVQLGALMTEDLYDFGAAASIAAPPDDMVVDYSSLSGSSS